MLDNTAGIDFAKLDGHGWADLLVDKPQFATQCEWQNLDGSDWARLLNLHPEFADKCDWEKLDWQNMDALTVEHPEFRRFQRWKPDVFVGYAERGRSIATSVSDKYSADYFLAVCGEAAASVDAINSCQVFVPVLTGDFDLEILEKVSVPIVPLWPNNESNRISLPDGMEVSTLDMTGTDFDSSLESAGCRFPREVLIKRNSVENYIEERDLLHLVLEFPEYLLGAKRIRLGHANWAKLLARRPDFGFACDFAGFDSHDWLILLMSQPSFASRCDFRLFEGRSHGTSLWSLLLRKQPQFADRCSFSEFTGSDWQVLLSEQPQFADKCDWRTLDGHDWTRLLCVQPQLAEQCDWEEVKRADSDDICYMLEKQPQFVGRCDVSTFDDSDWSKLIQSQSELLKWCDWTKVGRETWVDLVGKFPDLASQIKWPMLTGELWARLLATQPQFADHCDWGTLNGADWNRLLRNQPQFAERCDWKLLNGSDWSSLLLRQPKFSENCEWEKLTGSDWASLLIEQSQFWKYCDWQKLVGKDYVRLLKKKPCFAVKCDWSRLADDDWLELLEAQPQMAEYRIVCKEDDDCSYYDVYLCFDPEHTRTTADRLAAALEARGFGVYANFGNAVNEETAEALKVARHFMLIRSEGIFDHIGDPDYAIAQQLQAALKNKTDIVFIGPSDQKWQDPRPLPSMFSSLQTQQVKILDVGDMFDLKVDSIVRECLGQVPGALRRKFDVFISYRRSTGANFARRMQQGLRHLCCTSFLDYDSILNGKYDKVIYSAIDSSDVFLMCLTNGSLDRCCTDPDDWVAAEIRAARAKGMCIVPVTPSDQNWSLPNDLPADMEWLRAIKPFVIDMEAENYGQSLKTVVSEFPKTLQEKRSHIERIRDMVNYQEAESGLHWELPDLLSEYPDSLSLFPYRGFNGSVWEQILRRVPRLAYRCNWTALRDDQVVRVLCEQPQLATKPILSRLGGRDLSSLLCSQPQLADECDLERLDSKDLAVLLSVQPQFANRCNWEILDAESIVMILCSQPQFAPHCDWTQIDDGGLWVRLLKEQPQFADECDWSLLEGEDWVELLKERPQFAEVCNWALVAGVAQRDLCELLCRRPQFLDKIKWQNFTGHYLAQLLIEVPRLINVCDCDRLSGEAWAELVFSRPEFANRCDWVKVNDALRDNEWEMLIERRPQLAKFRESRLSEDCKTKAFAEGPSMAGESRSWKVQDRVRHGLAESGVCVS